MSDSVSKTKYRLVSSKLDDAQYSFSYGRGNKKLTTYCTRVDGMWFLDDSSFTPRKLLREAKADWLAWAEVNYGKSAEEQSKPETPATVADPATELTEAPLLEEMTDLDVMALDRLISRFGVDNMIKWLHEFQPEKLNTLLAKGLTYRSKITKAQKLIDGDK